MQEQGMGEEGAPSARVGEKQLVLTTFAPGDLVSWQSERGRRVGRFVGVVDRGRRRGLAEVVIGGKLMREERLWVPPARLRPVDVKGAAPASTGSPRRSGDKP